MTTLRDLWLAKKREDGEVWTIEDVIAHMRVDILHPISRPTLYKIIHHEGGEGEVKLATIRAICKLFGITLNDFEALEPYRPKGKEKK